MASNHTFYINSRKNKIHGCNFRDQIQEVLDAETAAYAMQSFDKFKMIHNQVHFTPTDNSKPLREGPGEPVGFTRYYIERTGRPLQVAKVRITNRKLGLFYEGEWTDLFTLLETIPTPATWEKPGEMLTMAAKLALWEKQWQWYYHNDLTFPFLLLPSEIREKIYSFLFPATFQPYPNCPTHRRPWQVSLGIYQDQGNASLLRVNRQLHNEASHILFRDSTFLLERTSILNRTLCFSPALVKNITRLELSFNHEQYLRLFGFYLNDLDDYDPRPAAYALRMLDLRLLTLRIGPPLTYNNTFSTSIPSCQKKALKYILRAAYPWVKGHPVEIVGFVTKKIKDRFEGVMREKRKEFEAWRELGDGSETLREWDEDDGGVELEEEGDVEEVREREREWPPRCKCRTHCGRVRWGSE